MKITLKFCVVVAVLAIQFTSTPSVVQASQCYIPTICEAFSRADSVFTGQLIEMKNIRVQNRMAYSLTFRVDKIFKGAAKSTEEIEIPASIIDTELNVGEIYLVYEDGKAFSMPPVCNRTGLLRQSVNDFEYAKNISWDKPKFEIAGILLPEDKRDLQNARVCVSTPSGVQNIPIDQNGFYSFVTNTQGEYKVTIEFPFIASIFTNAFGQLFSATGTKDSYSVSFKPNECDYREVRFAKKN